MTESGTPTSMEEDVERAAHMLTTEHTALQTGVEDTIYVQRIERIRRVHVETSPMAARYLDPPYDQSVGEAVEHVGYRIFHWQLALTTASMVAIVNGAVAGAVSLGGDAVLAVVVFLVSCGMHVWYQHTQWVAIDRGDPEVRATQGDGHRSAT